MAKYNGYTSWNAWNVSLWINSDENQYKVAYQTVSDLGYVRGLKALLAMWEGEKTPDGAIYNRTGIKQAIQDIL
tara:strand:+ start:1085 stop:1306 length:222 start_codon:yes stop_codon:yes gene_type:complete